MELKFHVNFHAMCDESVWWNLVYFACLTKCRRARMRHYACYCVIVLANDISKQAKKSRETKNEK